MKINFKTGLHTFNKSLAEFETAMKVKSHPGKEVPDVNSYTLVPGAVIKRSVGSVEKKQNRVKYCGRVHLVQEE